MILSSLAQSARYAVLHLLFTQAFGDIRRPKLAGPHGHIKGKPQ